MNVNNQIYTVLLVLAVLHSSLIYAQEDIDYLNEVNQLSNRIQVSKYNERSICNRLKLWYLEYQSPTYLEKIGGHDQMSEYLSGNCISDSGEFQVGLVGRKNKLLGSYMITFREFDKGLRIMYDPIGEPNDQILKNSKIIMHHILTGVLKEEYLTKY